MKMILVVVYACMCLLAGCSTYQPTAADYKTDYQRDGVYVLQRDVYIIEERKTMNGMVLRIKGTVDYPTHWLSDANDPNNSPYRRSPRLPTGTHITFKKIIFRQSFEMGPTFKPIGVVLDGTHSGIPVILTHVSKGPGANPYYGKYVNQKYLKLIITSGD